MLLPVSLLLNSEFVVNFVVKSSIWRASIQFLWREKARKSIFFSLLDRNECLDGIIILRAPSLTFPSVSTRNDDRLRTTSAQALCTGERQRGFSCLSSWRIWRSGARLLSFARCVSFSFILPPSRVDYQGNAGIGKTRLAQELMSMTQQKLGGSSLFSPFSYHLISCPWSPILHFLFLTLQSPLLRSVVRIASRKIPLSLFLRTF